MEITVNGQPQTLEGEPTLTQLLAACGMPAEGVAVALNMEVIPKAEWSTQSVRDGDAVEIVHMVGGG